MIFLCKGFWFDRLFVWLLISFLAVNKVIAAISLDFSKCGKTYGCIRDPDNCVSLKTCRAVTTFQYNNVTTNVEIHLFSRSKWVAFAQKPKDGKAGMVKLRGEYCTASHFGSFHCNDLTDNDDPEFVKTASGITEISREVQQGILSCRYTRPIVPPPASHSLMYDLSLGLLATLSYGDDIEKDSEPDEHDVGAYTVSPGPVHLLKMENINAESGKRATKGEMIHGILMILAWIICSTIGITMARYMKGVTKERKLVGKSAWFPLHVVLMVGSIVLCLASFILILVEKGGWSEGSGAHGVLGLITIVIGIVQPIMAFCRPGPDHAYRIVFNWLHRISGFAAWLLAAVAMVVMLKGVFHKDMIGLIMFVVVVLLLFLLFDVLMWRRGKQAPMDVSYEQKENNVEVKTSTLAVNKNSVYYLVLFAFIAFFSIIMGAYLSYEVTQLPLSHSK